MTITRKPLLFFAILFFLIIAVAPKAVMAVSVELRVSQNDPSCAQPNCFATIQSAINYANQQLSTQGTTTTYSIRVEAGTYNEAITLNTGLLVQGRETAQTVLIGPGSTAVFTLSGATNATIANFTIQNAALGISANNSTVAIQNMIFDLGTAGTAVSLNASPGVTIVNNVFFQNQTAISSNVDIPITNNIFSNNTTALVNNNIQKFTQVTYNSFFNNSAITSNGTLITDTTNTLTPNPLFVDTVHNDFHLQAGSPCIGTGNINRYPNIFNPATSDMGAYGGTFADRIPFVVSSLVASLPTPPDITLTWNPNNSYLTTGYRVYYGTQSQANVRSRVYNGTGAEQGPSPFIVTGATSTTLSSLPVATFAPAAPTLGKPQPMNQSLAVSWSFVPTATKYTIYFSTSPFDNTSLPGTFVDVNDGNATSYTLMGLTNNVTYYVAVSATAQNTYFMAVTAIDSSTGPFTPGIQDESTFSNEVSESIGPTFVSPISSPTQTAIPELLQPYPDLPSGTQGGCFIATAAYGDYSSPEVKILREFRDKYLLTSGLGSAFVTWYYRHSPAAAAYLDAHPQLKPLVRAALTPAVGAALFMTRTSVSVKIGLFMIAGCVVFLISRKRFSRAGGGH